MNERLTDAERRALLAGERDGSLDGEDAADLAIVADLLADPATWVEPDPGLEDRVVGAVATAGPRAAPSTPRTAASVRPRRGRRLLYAASVAASILIVAGVIVETAGSGSATAFSGRLRATSIAPGARADADVTRNGAGFRIALDARGLPRLHHDAYYQGWLENSRGGLVSIGTFSSSDGAIVLWSGVSPKEYRRITVTVEPDDDDPASSGRRVLDGSLRDR
jgi:hypothetical protein